MNLTESLNSIEISKKRNSDLIRKYLQIESEIKVKDDCLIGVGYNMCTDINFRAVDLFKLLQP